MRIVEEYIVFNRITENFVKVVETSDGKLFKALGSNRFESDKYKQISIKEFNEMCGDYNNNVKEYEL